MGCFFFLPQDNLLFSCCCARVDFSWTPVCDCYAGGYKCGQTCLEDALVSESVYATVGTVCFLFFEICRYDFSKYHLTYRQYIEPLQ